MTPGLWPSVKQGLHGGHGPVMKGTRERKAQAAPPRRADGLRLRSTRSGASLPGFACHLSRVLRGAPS